MVLAIVNRASVRRFQRWQRSLNFFALSFQPGWQDQLFSQVFHILVKPEAGAIRRQLEKDSPRLFVVHRLEPKSIDLRCRPQSGVCDSLPQRDLFIGILHPPGHMMYAANSPLTTAFLGQLFDFDQFSSTTPFNARAVPAIFHSKQDKAHPLCQYFLSMVKLPLPESYSMHASQLVF